jgi:hypothetical protein
MEDVDEAVLLCDEALLLCPGLHPNRLEVLDDLFVALATRFNNTGQLVDLRRACLLRDEAFALELSKTFAAEPSNESSVNVSMLNDDGYSNLIAVFFRHSILPTH